jgi:amidophosphoribosyltransferase
VHQDVFDAVKRVHHRVKGSYAVISMIAGHGLLAFRDPYGIRPLCYGVGPNGAVMVASESVALEGTGYEFQRDLAPGEAIYIGLDGVVQHAQCAQKSSLHPCIFEYVYLARPDSTMDGISVYQARLNLGETLAKRVISTVPPQDIDVVIPIPESSRPSATQLAHLLGKPYREGFVKNRYVGRTFIMPGQGVRKRSVRQKLNVIKSEFAGRNVLLVDDSIVRGTTSKEIVMMARDAGAKKVYLASAAPPVRFPNVYGIDMPTNAELVAFGRSIEEVREIIGCDALIYQDVDAMKRAILAAQQAGSSVIDGFDASCFDGVYVTGDVAAADIARMGQSRVNGDENASDNSRLSLPNFNDE